VAIEGIGDSCRPGVSHLEDDAIGEPEFTAGMASLTNPEREGRIRGERRPDSCCHRKRHPFIAGLNGFSSMRPERACLFAKPSGQSR